MLAKHALLALVVAALGACGSVAEWEERPGTLELFADPLEPQEGAAFWLGLRASDTGPIDVYQGERWLASYANVDLSEGKTYAVTAKGGGVVRAVTVGFDRQRLEVQAQPFSTNGPPPDAGAPDTGPAEPETESCPGAIEAPGRCSPPSSGAQVQVRMLNRLESPITVYNRPPDPTNANNCLPALVMLIGGGATRSFPVDASAVLRVIEDRSNRVVRELQVSESGDCVLVIE